MKAVYKLFDNPMYMYNIKIHEFENKIYQM